MKRAIKRSISTVLSFLLVLAIVCSINLHINAQTVDYVKSGKYIYNWGIREQTATFLSQNAEAFYKDNNTSFSQLAALAGSNVLSAVPSSALYKELQKLMESNHTYRTSYGGTRSLYQYTDCQNGGKTSKKISSFYSGAEIGPAWDAGNTWNREHTWPKSKTNYKSVDNSDVNEATDIMSLRPTAASENSSRSNKAYGTNTNGTYFNPNNFANGKYDLRGDCARIMLYVYVRWGNTSKMWGSSGVMESKDVLLEWVEDDPVDTWELGRNDSVESITGTRNVFVDYPELAFILFGEEIPSNYQSPSSNNVDTKPDNDQNADDTSKENANASASNGAANNSSSNGSTDTSSVTSSDVSSNSSSNASSNASSGSQGNSGNNTASCAHKSAMIVAGEDPTCESEGYTEGEYCYDCKQYISGHILIQSTQHVYSGDCDAECDNCNELREVIADAQHNFDDNNLCTVCGALDSDDIVVEETITDDENITLEEQTKEETMPEKQESKKNNTIWWIIAGSVVVIATGATLVLIFRDKIWPKES